MQQSSRILVALAALAWAPLASAQDGPPRVEAYGRLPAIQAAAISPDGARLALSIASEEATALRVFNLDAGAMEMTLLPPTDNKFRGVGWADDGHAIYYISRALRPHQALPFGYRFRGDPGRVEYWRAGILDIATQRSVLIMNDERAFANVSLDDFTAPIEGDPGYGRTIAFSGVGLGGGVGVGSVIVERPRLSVYRVSIARGSGRPQTVGADDTIAFALNARGEAVARVDVEQTSGRWRLIHYGADGERVLREGVTRTGWPLALLGVTRDGRIVAFDHSDDGVGDALVTIDAATGEAAPVVVADGVSPQGVILDPWSHLVVGAAWIDEFPRQHFFDASLQSLVERISPSFADGYMTIESWSADKSRVLIYGEHADDAGAYYVFGAAAGTLTRMAQRYPDLEGEADLGARSSIRYAARDGVQVPAYLTLPAGVEPRGLPLVLLVHGGPHARETFEFDYRASFLASRGYAVLQPNFRGSIGYGHDWYAAGLGQWGDGVMQTDIEDGMDALVRSGIADPARVCIMGGSYGGYAALAGAGLTPERYACAVSVNGVSDLLRMLDAAAFEQGSRSLASDWWRTSVGDRRRDRDELRAISPVNLADQFRTPVLLIHGEHDTVVPFEQSRIMEDRLRGAGKSVRLVRLRGDDHWLSDAESRIEMLRELERFLAEHLGPPR